MQPDCATSPDYGNLDSLRRTVSRAAQELLQQEELFQKTAATEVIPQRNHPSPEAFNVAFRASLKRSAQLKLNECDVRKEFTYEYVSGAAPDAEERKNVWPTPSLMREKSSAIQDLRARSESPSANKVLGEQQLLKDPIHPVLCGSSAEAQVAKIHYNPESGSSRMDCSGFEDQIYQNVNGGGERGSLAESLPESLAGFAATIISDEADVSPLISECDWQTNVTNASGSPAPLPDLMSLTSNAENLYVNTLTEDHYLPMTSAKRCPSVSSSGRNSPPPLPAANLTNLTNLTNLSLLSFEENAYVEMGDNKLGSRKPEASVFAGILDPSYRSPESPRYSEISDCRMMMNDQSHYEFLYKASGPEPVYMEVPATEDPAPPPEEELDNQSSSGSSAMQLQQQLPEEGGCVENGDLDLMIPPRHPRFSISDTFRPASYFLGSKSRPLEPIPADEDAAEASDSGSGSVTTDSRLRKPIATPLPLSPPQHGRSQSLDISSEGVGGRWSRCSVTSATSQGGDSCANSVASIQFRHGSFQELNMANRRRPLTIVRSLEDLLIDPQQLPQLPQLPQQQQRMRTSPFRGSTVSLTSSVQSSVSGMATLSEKEEENRAEAESDPLYVNVNVSLNSSRSETGTGSAIGAPYYYSDLHGTGSPLPGLPGLPATLPGLSPGPESLESTLTVRGTRTGRLASIKTPPSPPQFRLNSGRAQTPDLLGHVRLETLTETLTETPVRGDVMRRVRSLEGLLDDVSGLPEPAETPRYTRDPIGGPIRTPMKAPGGPDEGNFGAEFSPWDEDKLWRDKLRRASIRHTRSMDMLDEIHHSGRKKKVPPHPPPEEEPEEENGCYERLLQYSATLERAKRGQTFLDGYLWDELEQRFRRPESPSPSVVMTTNHFLEDSLPPPPTFEIDREKLRQWDLLSTAAPDCVNEAGRRPQTHKNTSSINTSSTNTSSTNTNTNDTSLVEKDPASAPDPVPVASKACGQVSQARICPASSWPQGDALNDAQVSQTRACPASSWSQGDALGDAPVSQTRACPASSWPPADDSGDEVSQTRVCPASSWPGLSPAGTRGDCDGPLIGSGAPGSAPSPGPGPVIGSHGLGSSSFCLVASPCGASVCVSETMTPHRHRPDVTVTGNAPPNTPPTPSTPPAIFGKICILLFFIYLFIVCYYYFVIFVALRFYFHAYYARFARFLFKLIELII